MSRFISQSCILLTLIVSANPEVQEKIRRVIEQGHIDPVDFNGVSEPVTLL